MAGEPVEPLVAPHSRGSLPGRQGSRTGPVGPLAAPTPTLFHPDARRGPREE